MDEIKLEALRIAANAGEPTRETMLRAAAYERFLRGEDKEPAYLVTGPDNAAVAASAKRWTGI